MFNLLKEEEKNKGKTIKIKKDEILYHEEEKCEYVGFVLDGLLEIKSYSLSGNEIIYNKINKGEMFGNNLILSSSPFYKGNVIAVKDSEIFLLDENSLLDVLQNNESFLESFLRYESDLSKKMNSKIKILSFSSLEERFLYFLKENNPLRIDSVTQLAKELNSSREALSRLLSSLEKQGKIKRKGKMITRSQIL